MSGLGPKAILALEDGTIFEGQAFGASASVAGEVCFNTSMTGYQEILTDPSYKGQIITMTYPLIGNYGVNEQDVESYQTHASGFVVRELSPVVSNYRADSSLGDYMERNGIPGIEGIDTRALTKKLRVRGAMNGYLTKEVVTQVGRIIHDRDHRESVVDNNYELGRRFFSYSVLRRKLRTLITNHTGMDDL